MSGNRSRLQVKVEPQTHGSLVEGNSKRPSKVVIKCLLRPSFDVVSILIRIVFRFPKTGRHMKFEKSSILELLQVMTEKLCPTQWENCRKGVRDRLRLRMSAKLKKRKD